MYRKAQDQPLPNNAQAPPAKANAPSHTSPQLSDYQTLTLVLASLHAAAPTTSSMNHGITIASIEHPDL